MKTFRNIAVVAALAGAVALPGFAHAGTLSDLLGNGVSVGASVSANILGILGAALGLSVSA